MTATLETALLSGVRINDVDTHISEPPDLWTSRVAGKWGDLVPHPVEVESEGKTGWFTGDELIAWAGGAFASPEYDADTLAGSWEPNARLAWMDRNGVYSQVVYPNILGFFVKPFLEMEPALRLECVRAYNDFQTEFCAADPARLIPLANLPWWDIEDSLVELARCREMGHRGVNLGWQYEKIGFPPLRTDHWAPLLRMAEEMGIPVNFHIGFSSAGLDASGKAGGLEGIEETELDRLTIAARFFLGNALCISELIMGRICQRYPTLKFVSVESGIGFIPYLTEALDWQFLNNNLHRKYPDMLRPSEYFRRQIYGTFWFEKDIASLAHLFPDNFMFESDYPHSTSLTPAEGFPFVKGPRDTILENLAGVPHELVVKLVQDNAADVYDIA